MSSEVSLPESPFDPLAFLEENCFSLLCVETAEDDYQWEVHAYHMTKPKVRVYGYGGTPKDAIDMAAQHLNEHGIYAPDIYSI